MKNDVDVEITNEGEEGEEVEKVEKVPKYKQMKEGETPEAFAKRLSTAEKTAATKARKKNREGTTRTATSCRSPSCSRRGR